MKLSNLISLLQDIYLAQDDMEVEVRNPAGDFDYVGTVEVVDNEGLFGVRRVVEIDT